MSDCSYKNFSTKTKEEPTSNFTKSTQDKVYQLALLAFQTMTQSKIFATIIVLSAQHNMPRASAP
ncbi:uncharacterized protein N7511_009900 [Penicillium nucicola]|uniref:uncharacterized protein n=1 Tax=Penicillium nucicola TaxID=1850975 RepID=UPI0025455134|nr:uncharacterized protein N7511_009900 [Penicillium nucicola]KAJ5748204.1 hypothetical protein N7511_009900 [Penicillium nucicola]